MPDRVVVDVGAATYGADESVLTLIDRYRPDRLYAFDPWPDFPEGTYHTITGTEVIARRAAAWIQAGQHDLGVGAGGLHATMIRGKGDRGEWDGARATVETFDLAEFLGSFDPADWVCLKLDVEGAEVVLLEHLVETGAIAAVDELLVEWHDHLVDGLADRKAALLEQLPEIQPW